MRTRTNGKRVSAKLAATAALVVLVVGGSATAAGAMVPSAPSSVRLCGSGSLVSVVRTMPPSLGGPYVLNLQAICLAP